MLVRLQTSSGIFRQLLQPVSHGAAAARRRRGRGGRLSLGLMLLQVLVMGNDVLQSDAIPHQQSDLDVHRVQILLEYLVRFDAFDDFVTQSRQLDFFAKILFAVV